MKRLWKLLGSGLAGSALVLACAETDQLADDDSLEPVDPIDRDAEVEPTSSSSSGGSSSGSASPPRPNSSSGGVEEDGGSSSGESASGGSSSGESTSGGSSSGGSSSGGSSSGGSSGTPGAGNCPAANTCATATNVGAICGENSRKTTVLDHAANRSHFVRFKVNECVTGITDLFGTSMNFGATFAPPTGAAYDVFVRQCRGENCNPCDATATIVPPNQYADFGVQWSDNTGGRDHFHVVLEVRQRTGTCPTTDEWELEVD